jgi:TetR/AcrR family transcriptional regulator, transcriptional repressor for nem operon
MKYQSTPTTTSKRNEILDAAERAILQKGVSSTTIEELIVEVGMSKNGFFYHFQDKNQMIEAILKRNLDLDKEWFEGLLHKANEASEDPLETFLAFLEILAMELSGNSDGHPGCMTTACCYQDRLLNNDVKQVAAKILIQWRQTSLVLLRKVAAQHPPRIDVDLQDMADMLPALIDGSIIFSRIVADWSILPRQIRLYRALVESTFAANTVQ